MKTKTIKTPFGTYEVETTIHHKGKMFAECEKDCPKGWEIATYELLQYLRNNHAKAFNLIDTLEFVQNPDTISRKKGNVAWFVAGSVVAFLNCSRNPDYSNSSLGVRFVRKVKK